MKRLLKWLTIALALAFVLIQFAPTGKTNPTIDQTRTLAAHVEVSPEVNAILQRSCMDCHSNATHWPWYAHVAPVSWYLTGDVTDARRHLNFDDWSRLNLKEADFMLGDICKTAKFGSMPLSSYTLIHRSAKLSAQDVGVICSWSNEQRQKLGR